jgi:hypothetical protein
MNWGKVLAPLALFALALGAALAFLPREPAPAQSAGMKTPTKTTKPAAKTKPAHRRRASAPKRVTRAAFIAEVKAIAARVDAGEERLYSSEEVKRALGL